MRHGDLPRVDFVITNPKHHLAMFAPVCRWLADRQACTTRVLSFCELRGFSTPTSEIVDAGAICKRVMPIKLSKSSLPRRVVKGGTRDKRLGSMLQNIVWYGMVRRGCQTNTERPALVVLPNDTAYPYDRIVQNLHGNGIPFLLMQEGIRFELPVGAHNGRQYGQGGASAVASWGVGSAKYFERVGVSSDKIHLTGNPRLDELQTKDWSRSAEILARKLGITSDVLLYVSNPIDQQGFCTTSQKYVSFLEFIRSADSFCSSSGYQLIVKIHTGESLDEYRAVLHRAPLRSRVTILREEPLYPLLYMAKAVVTMASTTGLEALLMNRPLGVLPVPGHGYVYDFIDNAGAVALGGEAGLEELLTALVDDSGEKGVQRQKYIKSQISNFGRAAETNAELVLRLINAR